MSPFSEKKEGINMPVIIVYILAVVILFVVLKIIGLSMKIISRFIFNALVGGIVLSIINLFGANIAITWVRAALVGFLGVPGVIIVLIMHFLV